MAELSPVGRRAVGDLAARHGFSPDAVAVMLRAVLAGHGSMAQFSHEEFGGSGQWMRGGMTMIGDMFNNSLKSRVDSLCGDLASLLAGQPGLIQTGSFQSQNQGGNHQGQGAAGPIGPASLFVAGPGGGQGGNWWPAELGFPASSGGQNNLRYAYFPAARRLAVEVAGVVSVYDTLDHQIGGFSQQQGRGGSLTLSSQHGLVDLASLPLVQGAGVAPARRGRETEAPSGSAGGAGPGGGDVFAAIEKLADLHARGILSEQEFNAKKAELLSRL